MSDLGSGGVVTEDGPIAYRLRIPVMSDEALAISGLVGSPVIPILQGCFKQVGDGGFRLVWRDIPVHRSNLSEEVVLGGA